MHGKMIVLVGLALCLAGAQAQFKAVPLKGAYNAYEPAIDNATMYYHSQFHYTTYLSNLNNLTANDSSFANKSLTSLITQVGANRTNLTAGTPAFATIRNSGGGAWNHAMFWKILAPVNSTAARNSSISSRLQTRIKESFGTLANMTAVISDLGNKQFGSGWSFLCVTPNGQLRAVATPNQDNPLMPIVGTPTCTPILGIDVWEHAYYLKYQNRRAAYVTAFWTVVDWVKVSQNYLDALAGKYANIAQ